MDKRDPISLKPRLKPLRQLLGYEETVILYSDHKELGKMLRDREVREQTGPFKVFVPRKPEDVIAAPSCLIFADADKLDPDLLGALAELTGEDIPSWRLVIAGQMPDLPKGLERYVEQAPYVWSRKQMVRIVKGALARAQVEGPRQTATHKRIYRIIALYEHIKEGKPVSEQDFCSRYGLTTRTLRRDVKLLRDLFPDMVIQIQSSDP